jgi:hypothetical protein
LQSHDLHPTASEWRLCRHCADARRGSAEAGIAMSMRANLWQLLPPTVAAVIAIAVSGCADAHADTAAAKRESAPHRSMPSGRLLPGGKVPGVPCLSARVSLGENMHQVKATVRCLRMPDEPVGKFLISASSTQHGPGYLPVAAFQRRPSVAGAGVGARHGTCRRSGFFVSCKAPLKARVRIAVDIWLRNANACDAFITVTGLATGNCGEGICNAPFKVSSLFDGRPRGCASSA